MKIGEIIENILGQQQRRLAERNGTPSQAKEYLKIIERRISVPSLVICGNNSMIEVTAYYVLK
jgi:hypothetical protein